MIIKGDSLMNQKLYSEAIQAYQIALTTSKDKELIVKYAHALHMNAEYKSEILAYEDILNGTPDDMSILLKKGIALTSLGNLDDAITVYRFCLTIDSLKPEIWFQMGKTFQVGQYHDNASQCLMKAIIIKNTYAEAYQELGTSLLALNNIDTAIISFRIALQTDSTLSEAWLGLGNALNRSKQTDKAMKAYKQAIMMKPDYSEAFNNLGMLYYSIEQPDSAISAINSALTFDLENPVYYNNAGLVTLSLGDTLRAFKFLEMLCFMIHSI